MCQISQKIPRETFTILMKNRYLGKSLQCSASLLNTQSTTPSYDTNNSIINFSFVTIFMTITLILAIKNPHRIIDCRETEC